MKNLMLAAASLSALASTSAHASVVISAVGANVNSGGPGFGSIADTYNQSGLSTGYISGVTDWNSYFGAGPTHTWLFNGYEWFSNNGSTSASVTYDLGSVMGIDGFALWNEESSGVGNVALWGSGDGVSFSSLGSFQPTDWPSGDADYGADIFGFTGTSARYLRFDMSRCPQPDSDFSACAIGEVAFRGTAAVPEPGTWAMLILGFFGVGGLMRSQRRKQKVTLSYA